MNRMLSLLSVSLGTLLAVPAFADEPPPAEAPAPNVVVTPPKSDVVVQPAPSSSVVVEPAPNSNVIVEPPAPATVPPPAVAPAPPPVYVQQPTYTTERETGLHFYGGLVVGGTALFSAAYVGSVITGAVANDSCVNSTMCLNDRQQLYIPIAGPFMALNDVHGSDASAGKALLAVDGGLQIAGAALATTGLIMSVVPTTRVRHHQTASLNIVPVAGPTTGLAAFGSF